jgi:RNA polymerase-binding transcription factor DksA
MISDEIDLANELAAREVDNILRARANAAAKRAAEAGPAVTACEDCDDALPDVRVAMRATRCVSCQERADKRARMFAAKR